ncbi:MAG: ABC transporter ATP-binding protein [Actinobacteria bacterium]|nr:ABC transporter ATP-binding protein [Actinomycetota bacterium]
MTDEIVNPGVAGAAGQEAGDRLVVSGITVATAKSHADVIEAISVEVRPGEILGLVGESGSGKTTLGLAMLGYARRGLTFADGKVSVDGEDVLGMREKELRELRGKKMAYVPQDPGTALNPALRIGSQMTEAMTAHGYSKAAARARIEELLPEVGLTRVKNLLQAYPHQLSGGQQQRVGIAMAFACRPGVIVMDEPTTGLDVTTQRTVLQTVRDLCRKYGVAAIYVSHDVLVVNELADRVAVVYSGRIVELGTTAQVLGSPRHPYTRGLLRAVPDPERSVRLVGIEGTQARPELRPSGCSFAPRCPIKMAACTTECPSLYTAGPDGHVARCLRVAEGADEVTTEIVIDEQPPAAPLVSEPVLEVTDLCASYGERQVLHDVSIVVPKLACVAVVGESGSGKTTLARCLIGLHTRCTGTMKLDGEELGAGIGNRSPQMLRRLQYVFQNPYASLNPRKTIGGILTQPLQHFTDFDRREQDRRVLEALRSVSLPDEMLDRYPDQLSGGERQRVAIARALVVEPTVLVCDEVTSALDVSVQAGVIATLQRLQAEKNLTIFFITHNLALVRSIAQQVVVMKDGTIVETGPTAELLDKPKSEYTRRLLEDVPRFTAAERRMRVEPRPS